MTFSNEGLTAWFDTPDAPAPPATGASRRGARLVVGARPASASNTVNVRYRVDGRMSREFPARLVRTDYATQTQYFHAEFPPLPDGDCVDYLPILNCAGRQAPAPRDERFVLSFRLSPPSGPLVAPLSEVAPQARVCPTLQWMGRVTAQLHRPPQVIGPGPDGLRINFLVASGTLAGAGAAGQICPGGCDSMIIRPDGVGVVRLRAALRMDDGALIAAEYEGLFDLGEGGYERALLGQFPSRPPLTLAPRFFTAAAKYRWMNRVQFIGVGSVTMSTLLVEYDLYAVHADTK